MAGKMTQEQWDLISKGLGKIEILCETTIPKLNNKIDLLWSSIEGNGHKGMKQQLKDAETDIKTIKERKEKAPVYSWKQVLAIVSIVLIVGTFITGFLTTRIEDQAKRNDVQYDLQSQQITKLSDMFYQHIIPNH
jgi:hypothetical protein